MKQLSEFTDTEKIKIFDILWEDSRDEFNYSAKGGHDELYFWESVMELVLEIKQKDWDEHNEGNIVYPEVDSK